MKSVLYDFKRWSWRKNLMNPRATHNSMYIPTNCEHWANTFSHGIMILPSIFAGELLLWKTKDKFEAKPPSSDELLIPAEQAFSPATFNYAISYAAFKFVSLTYAISLAFLFIVSTTYHWLSWSQSLWNKKTGHGNFHNRPSLTRFFHVCDRTTIYFFIAGSYTPWLTLGKVDERVKFMQWLVWVIAILGTSYTFLFLERNKSLETIFYVFAGLFPGIILRMYGVQSANPVALQRMEIGGISYLIGVLVFKLDGVVPFAHAIWHLFVACGAFMHYIAVYGVFYSSPLPP